MQRCILRSSDALTNYHSFMKELRRASLLSLTSATFLQWKTYYTPSQTHFPRLLCYIVKTLKRIKICAFIIRARNVCYDVFTHCWMFIAYTLFLHKSISNIPSTTPEQNKRLFSAVVLNNLIRTISLCIIYIFLRLLFVHLLVVCWHRKYNLSLRKSCNAHIAYSATKEVL